MTLLLTLGTWVMNLFSGGTISKLLDIVAQRQNVDLQKYQSGVAADTTVITSNNAAQVSLSQFAAQMAIADKGWWVTALMKPYLFFPCATYIIAQIVEALFHFGWVISPLRPEVWSIVSNVVLLTIGIVGAKGVARIFKT